MSDAPLSRGKFLRSLGSSLTGAALGTGVATAAQLLAGRVASVVAERTAPPVPNEKKRAEIPWIKTGPSEGKRIALTFDDGPTPGVTELILDELQQRKLHATFFMIGERVAAAPELARRVLAEGHEIGNHTFTHPKLTTLSDQRVVEEIQKTQNLLGEQLDYRPAWFRPPFGALRKNQSQLVQKEGLGIVFWSVDSVDWSQPGEAKIVDVVLAQTKPGAIILCHDLHLQTARSIGQILDELQNRQLIFDTVTSLIGKPCLLVG